VRRREFVVAGLVSAVGALGARTASGQQAPQQNFGPMEQGAYRPTLRPAKPDATRQLTDDQRDALEHRIKCQCGCILDIYTCRTTDFTCQVSPAMHRDVLRLIEGGYSADEILAAFVETYGEVALTEPVKEGFNWAGYLAPGVAMSLGAIGLAFMIRRWAATAEVARARAAMAGGAGTSAGPAGQPGAVIPGVSAEEMAKLERALREDG
jgi:cytochrome c-type biogenesis protein CcmH